MWTTTSFQASHFQPDSGSHYSDVMNRTLHAVNRRVVLDSADVAQAVPLYFLPLK